jgi:nucleoside-diphosphate-sugar epimerase
MTKIAILGANGQVGSEVCLALAGDASVEITGVVRSLYGTPLLALAGVPHAVADFDDPPALAAALGPADVVVDLTYPSGQLVEIQKTLGANLAAIAAAMRPGARYLHISSIMAFGMGGDDNHLADHLVPRVSYGYLKRWGEGEALRVGKARGIAVYVARLGQVHGVLQSVTHAWLARWKTGEVSFVGGPDDLSTTLFSTEVADAVLACARGALEAETVYTLVSNPQRKLGELCDIYRALHGEAEVSFVPPPAPSALGKLRGLVPLPRGGLRELGETYVLLRSPELFYRTKGAFRRRAVAAEVSRIDAAVRAEPLACLVGAVPGPLLPGLQSGKDDVIEGQRRIAARHAAALAEGRR